MANAQKENVIRIDTDNYTNPTPLIICGIKWKAKGTTPSASIKADTDSSGMVLWESNVAADTEIFEEVEIRAQAGIHVDIAGTGSILYLYLKV